MKRWLVLVACGHPAPVVERPLHVQHVEPDAAPDAVEDACGYLAQDLADYETRMHAMAEACADAPPDQPCGPDFPGPPACDDAAIPIDSATPPWTSVRLVCKTGDTIYGDRDCALSIGTTAAVIGIDFGFDVDRMHMPQVDRAYAVDLLAGSALEVIVEYGNGRDGRVIACTANPLACSAPIATSGVDDQGNAWTTTLRVDGRHLVLDAADGTPPTGVVGSHDPFNQ